MARSLMLAMALAASGGAVRQQIHYQNNVSTQSVNAKGEKGAPSHHLMFPHMKGKNRIPGNKIVNGEPADECEWTHQVGISSSAGQRPWCGGMLISDEWVLTAAHCMIGESQVNMVAGEFDTTQASDNEQNRNSLHIVLHPSYNDNTMDYDIALVKLESPFNLNSCVGTVRLPSADVAIGTACWITGWGTLSSGGGLPTLLQEGGVTVLGNSQCMTEFGYSAGEITDRMLCAQGILPNGDVVDACQGDSGGPLVCKENDQWVIHGATSWGYGCAGKNHPGVWARVFNQLTWIEEIMAMETFPTPVPTPAPPPCPSEFSIGPDGDGDCQCKSGLSCFLNGVQGACPYSYNDVSETWFLPTCLECVCVDPSGPLPTLAPTPPAPPTPPGTAPLPPCPSETSTGPDSNGDCRCNLGLGCQEDGAHGCTFSSTAADGKSEIWFLSSCTSCSCVTLSSDEKDAASPDGLYLPFTASLLALALWM